MGLGECVRGLPREMPCTLVIFAAKASRLKLNHAARCLRTFSLLRLRVNY